MTSRLIANEIGASKLKWALLTAAIAVASMYYFPQLRFANIALGQVWAWLNAGEPWPKIQ